MPEPEEVPAHRIFLEIARRQGDFAVAGVAALLALADDGSVTRASLALVGVAERVVRARQAEVLLEAAKPDGELLAEAATAVDQAISPRSDLNGSAAYRRHVAKVLTKRAILTAWRRAQQGEGVADAQA